MQVIGSFAGRMYTVHEITSWLVRLMLLTFSTMSVKSHLIVSDAYNKVSKSSSLFLRVKRVVLDDSLAGCRVALSAAATHFSEFEDE